MAVVVALSEEFNQRIGEKATNELAGVLNTMDTSVRSEMREAMDQSFAVFRSEMDVRFEQFRAEMKAGFASIEVKLSKFESRLLWTMMTFWTASLIAVLGVVLTAVKK